MILEFQRVVNHHCRYWQPDPGPLEEQKFFITAELSLQPRERSFLNALHLCLLSGRRCVGFIGETHDF